MTIDNGIHVGKPSFFDGNNYDYWKTRMTAHLSYEYKIVESCE
jgi:hypothetical protein